MKSQNKLSFSKWKFFLRLGIFLTFVFVAFYTLYTYENGHLASAIYNARSYPRYASYRREIDSTRKTVTINQSTASVPVLLYHGVVKNPDAINTELSVFKDEMYALKANGYQTVSLKDFKEFVDGQKMLPAKSFLLTFDDGRKDSFYEADPILKALDYQAVMFVISGDSTRGNSSFYLNRDELKVMSLTGRWDIEAHAYLGHDFVPTDQNGASGHFFANKEWLKDKNRLETDQEYQARVETDLKTTKETLEQVKGSEVKYYAIPYGDFGQDDTNYPNASKVLLGVAKKYFKFAFYQAWPPDDILTNFPQGQFMIRRITPPTDQSGADLVRTLDDTYTNQLSN